MWHITRQLYGSLSPGQVTSVSTRGIFRTFHFAAVRFTDDLWENILPSNLGHWDNNFLLWFRMRAERERLMKRTAESPLGGASGPDATLSPHVHSGIHQALNAALALTFTPRS